MAADPEQIYVEYLIDAATEADVIAWACDALAGSFTNDQIVAEIAGLSISDRYERERVGSLLAQLAERRGFAVDSVHGVTFAQNALRRACERYVAGETQPYELCRLVSPIEQAFDFPSWLGDLYNACDWVEPDTKRGDVPHLEDEAATVARNLK